MTIKHRLINSPECLPLKHVEFIKGRWKSVRFPPNMGGTRDIPDNATIDPSVRARMKADRHYRPKNKGLEYLSREVDAANGAPSNHS